MKLILSFFALLITCHNSFALNAKVDGNVITITGSIGYATVEEFDQAKREAVEIIKLADKNPSIHVFNLQDMPGGAIEVADILADFVRGHRYDTVITGHCISACARIFVAGVNRHFSNRYELKKNYIGLHAVGSEDNPLKLSDARHLNYLSVIYQLNPEIKAYIPKLVGNEMIYLFHPVFDKAVNICKNGFTLYKLDCNFIKGDAYSNGLLTTENLFEIKRY